MCHLHRCCSSGESEEPGTIGQYLTAGAGAPCSRCLVKWSTPLCQKDGVSNIDFNNFMWILSNDFFSAASSVWQGTFHDLKAAAPLSLYISWYLLSSSTKTANAFMTSSKQTASSGGPFGLGNCDKIAAPSSRRPTRAWKMHTWTSSLHAATRLLFKHLSIAIERPGQHSFVICAFCFSSGALDLRIAAAADSTWPNELGNKTCSNPASQNRKVAERSPSHSTGTICSWRSAS